MTSKPVENSIVVALIGLILLGTWFNSGTLSPYAATHHKAIVDEECGYLHNLDHYHFLGPFEFLRGAPREKWEENILLRRILYPILAYPLVEATDYELGGFLTNLIILALFSLLFYQFLRKRFEKSTALMGLALLATYPGLYYSSGLPYSYVMIVPCCLLGYQMLSILYETKKTTPLILCSVSLGVLSLAYDLIPYFLPALFLILLYQRRWLAILGALPLMILPMALLLITLENVYGIASTNDNSGLYGIIINSYLNPQDLQAWFTEIKKVPWISLHNYLYSSYLILPVLFVILIVVGAMIRKIPLHPIDGAIALAIFAVFLFSNMAPPYESKWQLRGVWIARLYQPLFIVFLMYSVRLLDAVVTKKAPKFLSWALVAIAIVAQGVIVFGPILGKPALADHVYYNYYQHSKPQAFTKNLKKFGRRPIGFCKNR